MSTHTIYDSQSAKPLFLHFYTIRITAFVVKAVLWLKVLRMCFLYVYDYPFHVFDIVIRACTAFGHARFTSLLQLGSAGWVAPVIYRHLDGSICTTLVA